MRFVSESALFAALAAFTSLSLPAAAHAYGEPGRSGALSHEERLLHVFTNQVRQAPHDWPDWDTSLATADARRPLLLDDGLVEASRFHAEDMATNDFFAHESFDGTSFFDRLRRYFAGPAGENIYTGFSGDAYDAITGWMNSEGHRVNILTGSWNLLGPGFAAGGSQLFYVQDFGETRNASIPAIPGGALEHVGGGQIRLIANYHDADGLAPRTFDATLGGRVIALEHVSGPAGNETRAATADEPEECEPLYFTAVDTAERKTLFPTTGALLAGRGCTSTYRASRTDSPGTVVIDADDPKAGCRCVTADVPSRAEDFSRGGGRRHAISPRTAPADPISTWGALLLLGGLVLVRRRR